MLFTEEAKSVLTPYFSNGKVPFLIDDGFEVWDFLAVLEYLAESYPGTNGWPRDQRAKVMARAVSAEMHSGFSELRSALPMNCHRYFPGYRLNDSASEDVKRIQAVWRRCRTMYGKNGPWLFGDFSIADAMYAPIVMRFRSIDIKLDLTSQEYCETMHACGAVQQWLAEAKTETAVIDKDELDWPGEPVD